MSEINDFDNKQLTPYQKEYSEEKLKDKLSKYAKNAGAKLVFYVLELYYVMMSSKTSLRYKAIIVGALGYFISPFDIIPDLMPVLGYTDDVAVLLAVIKAVSDSLTPDIKERAFKRLQDWFPDVSVSDIDY